MNQNTQIEQPAVGRSLFSFPPALRYPAYRRYWLGTLGSVSGFQMLIASQFWLVHTLEESPLYLGYVGAAEAVPAIGLNLFGGVFADKLDKRRLIMVTQTILASLMFLLGTLTLLDVVQIWHILAIAFLAGSVDAFDQPARQALYPQLIDRRAMISAVALNSSVWQGTRIVAPAVAGLIIATAGTATAFYVSSAGFLTMAAVIWRLNVPPMPRGATGGSPADNSAGARLLTSNSIFSFLIGVAVFSSFRSTVRDLMIGVRFIKSNSIFSFLIGMTFFNSFFGMAYIALMPIFAEDLLGQGPSAYGLLFSAGGVGSLLTTLVLSSRDEPRLRGSLIIGGATMFGLVIATFGLTSHYVGSYSLALALMFVMGSFSSMYMISIMSSLQTMVPDGMRGRVMGFYGMTWSIMPLGGLQAGAMATLIGAPIGAPIALAIGGLAVTAFAIGPAMINSRVRNLGALLSQFDRATAAAAQRDQVTQAASSDD